MEQLGNIVAPVSVDARLGEAATRIDEFEQSRDRIVKDVREAQIAVNDLAHRLRGNGPEALLDFRADPRPTGQRVLVEGDLRRFNQPRELGALAGKVAKA